jgi:hypothetical protein
VVLRCAQQTTIAIVASYRCLRRRGRFRHERDHCQDTRSSEASIVRENVLARQ